jgi:glutathione synthase
MTLRIAIQMDDPAGFNPKSDSTLILGLEAQKRGYQLFYYLPRDISYRDGSVWATAKPIRFFDDLNRWYEADAAAPLDLRTVDVVLMRQDPPYDMNYLTATYLLDVIADDTLVMNDPTAVRDAPEKLSILQFTDYIPPTCITRDLSAIDAFRQEHGEIIVKPLYGYGGHEVYYLKSDDANLDALLEHYFTISPLPLIIQRFLPEVKGEDRRVILIDGNVEGVIGRIPASGHVRANMRVGGQAVASELNAKQQQICEEVGALIALQGIIFAGLDLIGDYLTEINVTSPTGLRAVMSTAGHNPAVAFWDAVESRL